MIRDALKMDCEERQGWHYVVESFPDILVIEVSNRVHFTTPVDVPDTINFDLLTGDNGNPVVDQGQYMIFAAILHGSAHYVSLVRDQDGQSWIRHDGDRITTGISHSRAMGFINSSAYGLFWVRGELKTPTLNLPGTKKRNSTGVKRMNLTLSSDEERAGSEDDTLPYEQPTHKMIDDLPNEILERILVVASAYDDSVSQACRLVCQRWRDIVDDDHFRKTRFTYWLKQTIDWTRFPKDFQLEYQRGYSSRTCLVCQRIFTSHVGFQRGSLGNVIFYSDGQKYCSRSCEQKDS